MKLHILGVCGTFMGGLARLAIESGHRVTGSDANVYPPMSEQLNELGIPISHGYAIADIPDDVEQIIIGNTLSRGNLLVEHILNTGIQFTSGPQWLAENILVDRHVIAVAGTHGKTTTSSMLAWILHANNKKPGFLIGGVAENFAVSASLGESEFFVIEADEYDSAFFDKRSKFIHYQPNTLIINNIEFDHADIFRDLESVLAQFHHLLKTVPETGQVIINTEMENCQTVLEKGCWSQIIEFGESGKEWGIQDNNADYSYYCLSQSGKKVSEITWPLLGSHNALNALAATIAASHVGVEPAAAGAALAQFKSVKRRLQKLAVVNGIHVYDDFAHHPTAITLTLKALRAHVAEGRIIVILEPRSNTMKMGVHKDTLAQSLILADAVYVFEPANLAWDLSTAMLGLGERCRVFDTVDSIVVKIQSELKENDHVVIMSNGGFDNIHQRLIKSLS